MILEYQLTKKYQDKPLRTPHHSLTKTHATEAIYQVEVSGVVEGGGVGRDTWFGSGASCVELRKKFKVGSVFIVKNNTSLLPMKVLT